MFTLIGLVPEIRKFYIRKGLLVI